MVKINRFCRKTTWPARWSRQEATPDARTRADAWRAESRELGVQRAEQVLEGVTFSVGVATYPTHGDNRERLIAAADQALYRAKAEGRDRVVIAEPVLRSAVNPPTPIA
ncbi:MAG: diguanylate cyclase [bacterium]